MKYMFYINSYGKAYRIPMRPFWSPLINLIDGQTITITYRHQKKPDENYKYWRNQWHKI